MTAVTAVLALLFAGLACHYTIAAVQTCSLDVHHLQWLALSVLMMAAVFAHPWERNLFAEILTGFGVPGAHCLAGLAVWVCTAAAAAVVLPARNIRALLRHAGWPVTTCI